MMTDEEIRAYQRKRTPDRTPEEIDRYNREQFRRAREALRLAAERTEVQLVS